MPVSTTAPLHATAFDDLDLNSSVELLKDASNRIYASYFDNSANSAKSYAKLWNLASGAPPTIGTSVPHEIFMVPASGQLLVINNGSVGALFATGLYVAGTTTGGTGGATGPVNDLVGTVWSN